MGCKMKKACSKASGMVAVHEVRKEGRTKRVLVGSQSMVGKWVAQLRLLVLMIQPEQW